MVGIHLKQQYFGYYTVEEINNAEKREISNFNSYYNGYNSTKGGDALFGKDNPMYGKHHTPEQKKMLSERFSGKRNPRYGKEVSTETREKISKKLKGRFGGENHPNFGKPLTEEWKEKIRIANTGKKLSDTTISKIIESNKTRYRAPLTEESRQRIGVSKKGENSPIAKKVVQIDPKTNKIIKIFLSASDAGKEMGLVNGSQITACCKGRQKTSAGFIWKYHTDI